MAVVPATQTMTAAEYLARPLDLSRGIECLVEGELVVNEPDWQHQQVVLDIAASLKAWIERGAGRGGVSLPIDVGLDDRNVYAPDVSWYRDAPAHQARPYPVPDIAAEVRSPSTWRYDVGTKKSVYERHGLPELWLVDTPASEVLVFRRSSRDAPRFDVSLELGIGDELASPLLPGFALALARLFRG